MLFQIYSGLVQVWSTIYLGLIEASFEVVQGLFRLFWGGRKKKTQTSTTNVFNRSFRHLLAKAEKQKSREGGNRSDRKRTARTKNRNIYIYI